MRILACTKKEAHRREWRSPAMADEGDDSCKGNLDLCTGTCLFDPARLDSKISHSNQIVLTGTSIGALFHYEVSGYIATYDRPHEKKH